MLCQACQKLIKGRIISARDVNYTQRGGIYACESCTILSEVIEAYPAKFHTSDPWWEAKVLSKPENSTSFLRLKCEYGESESIDLHAIDGVSNPWNLSSVFVTPEQNNSSATMHRVSEWLRDCSYNHSRCVSSPNPTLPTRIIDIGFSRLDKINIMESNGRKGRYLCLSYCWGRQEFINTTEENLANHKEEIPWKSLPQVFQDTIDIAHFLKIRYLWIDALCILQKNKKDWESESGNMANTYRKSFLTVAAVSAMDVYQNCFSARKNGVYIGPVVSFANAHFPKLAPIGTSEEFPMLTRSWTYQERLLAPRVLYVGRREMLWDCFEHRTCECGMSRYTGDELKKTSFYDVCLQRDSNPDALQGMWYHIVVQYSSLRLSIPDDRLPAVSALADIMYDRRGKSYLAGLWKNTLLWDLCWWVCNLGNRTVPSGSPQRAPTWSWASVDYPVQYSDLLYCRGGLKGLREHAKVHEAICIPEGLSPTGRVREGGFLMLRGQVIPVRFHPILKAVELDTCWMHYQDDGRVELSTFGGTYIIPLVSLWDPPQWTLLGMVITPSPGCHEEYMRAGLAVGKFPWDKLGKEELVKIV